MCAAIARTSDVYVDLTIHYPCVVLEMLSNSFTGQRSHTCVVKQDNTMLFEIIDVIMVCVIDYVCGTILMLEASLSRNIII